MKQKEAAKKTVEYHGNVGKAMRAVGYSPNTAKNPKILTGSKGWEKLMEKHLSDKKLAEVHDGLLNSTRIDHLVFPLGPKDEDDINFSGAKIATPIKKKKNPIHQSEDEDAEEDEDEGIDRLPEEHKERSTLTDKEIIAILAEVNCKVRRIVHGENARHVYFWAPDNKSRKEGLDMAYKLKARYKDRPQGDEGPSAVLEGINQLIKTIKSK